MTKASKEKPGRISRLLDKYQSLIIATVLLLLIGQFATAQPWAVGVRQTQSAKGFVWKEGEFTYVLKAPNDTLQLLAVDSNAMAVKGGCLYILFNGKWRKQPCDTSGVIIAPTFAFSVQPLTQTVESDAIFSLNASVINGTGPYTYTWHQVAGPDFTPTVSSSTSNAKNFAVTENAQFYVTATTTANGTITSSTANITVIGAAPSVTYGYSSSDPYVNNSTAPTIGSPQTTTIAHNADISVNFAAAAVDKFLVFKVPSTESTKVVWYVEPANNGSIPDAAFRAPFTVSGFTYYVTRDAAGFTFNYTLPVQLKQ